jgi:hypothetical protein
LDYLNEFAICICFRPFLKVAAELFPHLLYLLRVHIPKREASGKFRFAGFLLELSIKIKKTILNHPFVVSVYCFDSSPFEFAQNAVERGIIRSGLASVAARR